MSEIILRSELQRKTALDVIARLDLKYTWRVEVKRYVQRRSINANALYWKWIGIIAQETGNDADDVHEAMKAKFLAHKIVMEEPVRPSTTKLSKPEMSAYMEQTYQFATAELGIILPVPEEMHAR